MIWARSLFIISVVKPGTGECCQTPPFSSNFLPSAVMAAPSLPADHCEIAVRRGLIAPCARANAGSASVAADPASSWRLVVVIGMASSSRCELFRESRAASDISGGLGRRGRHAAAASEAESRECQRRLRIVAVRRRHESERHLRVFAAAQQAGVDPLDERVAIVLGEKRRPAADRDALAGLHVQRIADRKAKPE